MNDLIEKKLAILIVAAGCSSRLGQAKQLVQHNSVNLLQKSVKLATTLSDNVLCVLGYQADLMQQQISHLNVQCLVNRNWQQGMGSSIASGVKKLTDQTDGVLILLCDQWALTKSDLKNLIECWQQQPDRIIASHFFSNKQGASVTGSPAIFPSSQFRELQKLKKSGARILLKDNQSVIHVEMGNAEFDLDTPQDLRDFQLRINKKESTNQ